MPILKQEKQSLASRSTPSRDAGWRGIGWACGHAGWDGMVWDGQTAANSIQQEVMGWLGDGTREVSEKFLRKLMKDLGAICPTYQRTPNHT